MVNAVDIVIIVILAIIAAIVIYFLRPLIIAIVIIAVAYFIYRWYEEKARRLIECLISQARFAITRTLSI